MALSRHRDGALIVHQRSLTLHELAGNCRSTQTHCKHWDSVAKVLCRSKQDTASVCTTRSPLAFRREGSWPSSPRALPTS